MKEIEKLPPFKSVGGCEKCGLRTDLKEPITTYRRPFEGEVNYKYDMTLPPEPECLLRKCYRCGFSWREDVWRGE